MAATYDNTLPTDRDHVRFLIGDTDTSSPLFQNEEITAVINDETATGEALKYYAAARCLSVLSVRWANSGRGLVEKQVSKLRKKWGVDSSSAQTMNNRIDELRKRGAWLLTKKPRMFRALGPVP